MAETKLDALVRRLMLRYPSLFSTRWEVLRHLYLVNGNGYEWEAGELVDVHADLSPYPGDDECRFMYFRDLDKHEAEFARFSPDERSDLHNRAERARRQFTLDNLDLLAVEPADRGLRSLSWTDVASASVNYSHAFNVPDDVEASFKAGAVEVLNVLIPGLYYPEMQGRDDGLREAACDAKERLAPVDHAAMEELTAHLLRDLRAES